MSLSGVYSTGTISLSAGGTSVTGVGTAWSTTGIQAGDTFIAAGMIALVSAVTDNTHLTLSAAWPGSINLSGVAYQIIENSWLREDLPTSQRQLTQFLNIINGTGVIHQVAAGGTPDVSLGEDGQYALDFENYKWWKKAAGVWTGPRYITGNGLVPAGAWSSATTYNIGSFVTYSSNTYVSLQNTNLNHTPSGNTTNTAYWMWVPSGATGQTGAA